MHSWESVRIGVLYLRRFLIIVIIVISCEASLIVFLPLHLLIERKRYPLLSMAIAISWLIRLKRLSIISNLLLFGKNHFLFYFHIFQELSIVTLNELSDSLLTILLIFNVNLFILDKLLSGYINFFVTLHFWSFQSLRCRLLLLISSTQRWMSWRFRFLRNLNLISHFHVGYRWCLRLWLIIAAWLVHIMMWWQSKIRRLIKWNSVFRNDIH